MEDIKSLIEQAYSAFNKRDIDTALALMAQDVSWPKASEGGKIIGKEEVRYKLYCARSSNAKTEQVGIAKAAYYPTLNLR